MRRLALAAALFAAAGAPAGCGEGGLTDFELQLSLNGWLCDDGARCSDFGMECGAIVQVRILPDEPGAPPYEDRCVGIWPGQTLCSLDGDLQMQFTDLAPGMARIQVALWGPGQLGWDARGATQSATPLDVCPDHDVFDRRGYPRTDLEPSPAIGGSRYVRLGREEQVMVHLECANPAALAECPAPPVVRATVDDLETMVFVPGDQAANLSVSAGKPRSRQNPLTDEEEWLIDGPGGNPPGTFPLPLDIRAIPPAWSGEVPTTFDHTACVQVLENAPQATTSATCYPVTDEQASLELTGYLVPRPVLDEILTAADIVDGFPPAGLVIGRVVDHQNAPLAGVQVTPTEGTVRYLNAARDGLHHETEEAWTSESGYFLSQDVPFNARWTALHLDDLRSERGEYFGGLLLGKVSVVVIEMEPPP